eukprot:COSAG01_NODE_2131_length_8361_cov_7.018276_5_plen_270_part_00
MKLSVFLASNLAGAVPLALCACVRSIGLAVRVSADLLLAHRLHCCVDPVESLNDLLQAQRRYLMLRLHPVRQPGSSQIDRMALGGSVSRRRRQRAEAAEVAAAALAGARVELFQVARVAHDWGPSGAALMWGVAKCTIKVLLCYLKQSTASRRAARPGCSSGSSYHTYLASTVPVASSTYTYIYSLALQPWLSHPCCVASGPCMHHHSPTNWLPACSWPLAVLGPGGWLEMLYYDAHHERSPPLGDIPGHPGDNSRRPPGRVWATNSPH